MSGDVGHSTEPPPDDDTDPTARSKRAPMSAAAHERLERFIAGRAKDPEFLRKVEAIRRQLSEQSPSQ